jgi:iron complex outermembrane receptor protein
VTTSGLDFNVHMTHPTGFGTVFGTVDGNYILTYNQQAYPGGPVSTVSQNNISQLHMSTAVGATLGPVLAQATWQYTQGFAVAPTATALEQSHVDAFSVINLAFQYTPEGNGLWQGVTLNLNIDNVFDKDPPLYNGNLSSNTPGYYGFTLGRFIQLGIKKKF